MRRVCQRYAEFQSRPTNLPTAVMVALALASLVCIGGCGSGSSMGQNATGTTPKLTSIDAPGAGTASGYGTFGTSIDAGGDVAGLYIDANGVVHGFIRAADGSITKVDAPDAGTALNLGTNVRALNASGSATGYYADTNDILHSYLRSSSGTLTEFDPPNSIGSDAFCMNDSGDIAGGLLDVNGAHGFMRGADGTFSVIDPTGTASDVKVVIPTQINSVGAVAGYYTDTNTVRHGFLRGPSGAVEILDAPGAATMTDGGTEVTDMNSGGVMVGGLAIGVVNGVATTRSFMLAADGSYTEFDPPQAVSSYAEGINDNGVIAGEYRDAKLVRHGYIRQADGSFITFDAPNAALVPSTLVNIGTAPRRINGSGEIVGTYSDAAGVRHAFVRQ